MGRWGGEAAAASPLMSSTIHHHKCLETTIYYEETGFLGIPPSSTTKTSENGDIIQVSATFGAGAVGGMQGVKKRMLQMQMQMQIPSLSRPAVLPHLRVAPFQAPTLLSLTYFPPNPAHLPHSASLPLGTTIASMRRRPCHIIPYLSTSLSPPSAHTHLRLPSPGSMIPQWLALLLYRFVQWRGGASDTHQNTSLTFSCKRRCVRTHPPNSVCTVVTGGSLLLCTLVSHSFPARSIGFQIVRCFPKRFALASN